MASATKRRRVLIMGAERRDFHNFNVVFRDDASCAAVAFTAGQIPGIAGRRYPPSLAGTLYPNGIAILDETNLATICRQRQVDEVIFAYSDVEHVAVMHKASIALAAGADFSLLGPRRTMLRSKLPVIAICAVRTGVGKSLMARWLARRLKLQGAKAILTVSMSLQGGDLRREPMWRWRGLLRQAVDRPQIAGLVAHIGRIEPMTLSAVILGAVLLLVFASLANAVAHGNTHAFDEWLIIALRTPGDLADPLGPKWLEEMTRDFTALGSTGVLALMVLAIAGFLAMTYKRHGALLVLVSVAGGVFISQTMKWAYARARPTWCRMGRKSSALGEWLKYSLDTSSGRSEKSKLSSAIRRSRDQSIIRSSTAVDCSPPVWARSRAVRRALN